MKIAIQTEILSTHSGSRAPIELSKYLSLNNEITLLAFDLKTEKEIQKDLEKRGIRVVLITPYRIPLGKWLAAFRLLPHLRKNEIISFHGTLPTFLAAKLSGIPIARTYYGTQLDAYFEKLLPNQKPNLKDKILNWLGNRLILLIQRFYFDLSNQSVAISECASLEAKRLFGRKIPHIYLGTDLATGSKLTTSPEGGPITTISVSRITPYKGFHSLIEVFKNLNKEIPQARLTIIGSAPNLRYLNYLRNLTKDQPNIKILTDISDQQLARLYQACQIYATCDRYLFFGLPLVEAASFGKPSVALDLAAASEIIQHGQTGYVAKNLSSLTEFLKKLIFSQNLRNRLGEKAKERARILFDWQKIAKQYEELFGKVLFKKRGGYSFKLPILIVLTTSLIFGLPHLVIPLFQGGFKNYQPLVVNKVSLLTYEETRLYGAQAREVYEGHLLSADAHLAEYKNLPQASFILPPLFAGSLARLTGSLQKSFVINDFLLPPLIFLFVYLLLFELTAEPLISILGGVLLLTANRLFLFLPPLTFKMAEALWEIFMVSGKEIEFLEFSRFPYPQFAFFLLILHLYSLLLALRKKSLFLNFLSAVTLGLLFYTYFYYWTFALVGEIILFFFLLSKKNFNQVKTLSLVVLVALSLSIPFWISFLKFHSLPVSKDILERVGLELGKVRNVVRTVQYSIFTLFFFALVKKKKIAFFFFLAFLLGGIILLNLQLLTGWTIQSWHWTVRVLNPLSILILVYLFHQILTQNYSQPRLEKLKNFLKSRYSPLLIILIALFLFRALALQFVSARNTYQSYTLPKTTLEAFAWLDKNTPLDSVIITPSFETISQVPVFTHNNVFLPNGTIAFASNEEIFKRLLITYKIFGLGKSELEKILSYRGDGLGNCQGEDCLVDFEFWEKQGVVELFHMKYLKKDEGLTSWSTFYEIPKKEQERILTSYDQYLKSSELIPAELRLDYLYYGPAEKKIREIDFSRYWWAKEIYHNQDVQIYKIEK